MRKLLPTLFSFIFALSIHAQDKYDPIVIECNNIREIEGYIVEEGLMDSFLITKEYFNSKGRRTKIEIYDSLGIKSEYLYKYKNDTIRIERITKLHGLFHSKTKIYLDKKNREVKAVDFDEDGKKTGTYSKTKYNDRKRTKETKIYFTKKLSVHTKEKFDSEGSIVQYAIKKNGKWKDQLTNGSNPNRSEEEFENYENTGFKLERVTNTYTEKNSILGLNGTLKLLPNDILTTERYINSSGLIEMVKQYLNGNLINTKKYKYVS